MTKPKTEKTAKASTPEPVFGSGKGLGPGGRGLDQDVILDALAHRQPGETRTAIAERLGVEEGTLRYYEKHSAVEILQRASDHFVSSAPAVFAQVAKQAEGGHASFVRLYLEVIARFGKLLPSQPEILSEQQIDQALERFFLRKVGETRMREAAQNAQRKMEEQFAAGRKALQPAGPAPPADSGLGSPTPSAQPGEKTHNKNEGETK